MFMQVEVPVHEQTLKKFCGGRVSLMKLKFSLTCANFAVQKVASVNKDDFPQAAEAVFDSFYVDDFLKSFASVDEAIEVMTQLIEMMKRGGFKLTKFITSSESVFESNTKTLFLQIHPFLTLEMEVFFCSTEIREIPLFLCLVVFRKIVRPR